LEWIEPLDLECLVAAIGRLEAMTEANLEKMESLQGAMDSIQEATKVC
jgi:hypothetical protein